MMVINLAISSSRLNFARLAGIFLASPPASDGRDEAAAGPFNAGCVCTIG